VSWSGSPCNHHLCSGVDSESRMMHLLTGIRLVMPSSGRQLFVRRVERPLKMVAKKTVFESCHDVTLALAEVSVPAS